MTNSLGNNSTREIFQLYADIMQELKDRNILRTMNNPVAGYGEYLACKALGLNPSPNSEKGYDAEKDGIRYEIKSRRIALGSRPTRFSPIRDIDNKYFNFLVAIIFDIDFNVNKAVLMPYEFVREIAKYQRHVNGWILLVRDIYNDGEEIIDITQQLLDAQS